MTPQRKRQVVIATATAVVLLIILIVVFGTRLSGASSADPALKRTAQRVLPLLNHPHSKVPINDASINSFKAWVYAEQPVFVRISKQALPNGQFIQVEFIDTNSLPPQDLGLNAPGRAFVQLDSSVTSQVGQNGPPQYTNASSNGQSYRVYVAPITVPAPMQGSSIYGLVEVLGPS